MKHYYAAQGPRGFGNEVHVIRFSSRRDRDDWVDEHRSDGDCNSASQGAYAITAREARQIAGYRGDANTESYNYMEYEHTVDEDGEPLTA